MQEIFGSPPSEEVVSLCTVANGTMSAVIQDCGAAFPERAGRAAVSQ